MDKKRLAMDADTIKAQILHFLDRQMAGEVHKVADMIAPGCKIIFSGGREFSSPAEISAFNAGRYAWVRKKMERTDVAPCGDNWAVFSIGTLYGAWPDGTEFEGNRYIDRFELENGRIVLWEVWNDSGERLLARHGITA
ncbi:MAG: hypothetical protein ACJA1F_002326 [Paracoccaceae bacterium]|jgi:hypothetical protein